MKTQGVKTTSSGRKFLSVAVAFLTAVFGFFAPIQSAHANHESVPILGAVSTAAGSSNRGLTHAGVEIGNEASATFTDASGERRSVLSNRVETIVQQVDAFILDATVDITAPTGEIKDGFVSPGGNLLFHHTLYNTGNGTTSFDLISGGVSGLTQVGGDSGSFVQMMVYEDANGSLGAVLWDSGTNGVVGGGDDVDNINPADPTSYFSSIPSGGSKSFWVKAIVPNVAVATETYILQIEVDSVPVLGTPAPNQFGTDRATVTDNAVVTVSKSVSIQSAPAFNPTDSVPNAPPDAGPIPALGNPNTTFRYTLEYQNTGLDTATDLIITDTLPLLLDYVGFPTWSAGGALTDLDTGPDSTVPPAPTVIHYCANQGASLVCGTGKVQIKIAGVPGGVSGSVSFDVKMKDITTARIHIPNTATYSYNNGAAVVAGVSNSADFIAEMAAQVAADGDDQSLDPALSPGDVVVFENFVYNEGAGEDTFDMSYQTGGFTLPGNASGVFPPGTAFSWYMSDGQTPLGDSNGNTIPDTGPIPADGSYKVVLKAVLPLGATGGKFAVQKTATSAFNTAVSVSVFDISPPVQGDKVDISDDTDNDGTNDGVADGGGDVGANIGSSSDPAIVVGNNAWEIKLTNPGGTVVFPLWVRNAQGNPDTYQLAYAGGDPIESPALLGGVTGADSFPGKVPSGCTPAPPNPTPAQIAADCWDVVFRSGPGAGAPIISDTGNVPSGASVRVFAHVTVPSLFPPGTVDIYFQAKDDTTSIDQKHDAVTVNQVRTLSLSQSGVGTVNAGGQRVYQHQLTNLGNTLETGITLFSTNTGSFDWASMVHLDDGDGAFNDALDLQVVYGRNQNTASLLVEVPVGGSITLWVVVKAAAGLQPGDTNVTGLIVKPSGATASVACLALPPQNVAPPYTVQPPPNTNPPTDPSTTTDTSIPPDNTVCIANVDNTTVMDGNLRLIKKQALDSNCDGAPDGFVPSYTEECPGTGVGGAASPTPGYTTDEITVGAIPTACILYEIVVTNLGNIAAEDVVLNDTVPANTTLSATVDLDSAGALAQTFTGGGVDVLSSPPNVSTTPALGYDIAPSGRACLRYGVKID